MKIFKKFFFLLNQEERKHSIFLLIMITIMAILDMVGVASILPFITILTNQDLIQTNIILKNIYKFSNQFGVNSNEEFLVAFGIFVFFVLIISLAFKTVTTYFQIRFVHMREYSIGRRLMEGYLNQPYGWFISSHSSDIGKNILSEVQQLIRSGVSPLIDLISKCMIVFVLVILLIVVNPKIAIIVGITLGSSYIVIFYFVQNYLNRIGKKRLLNNQLRYKTTLEAFGAIKEVKVNRLEKIYLDNFENHAKNFAKTETSSIVISQIPRFFLEAIAFGGFLLIVLYMMTQTGSINQSLPIISLYAFAGYRILPSLQRIYSSLTNITYIKSSLDKLYYDLKLFNNNKKIKNLNYFNLNFNKEVNLNNVSFCYQNSSKETLQNIDLNIPKSSKIGIIGTTGSGKTTLVDIILGLLKPTKGTLEVDGKKITNKNLEEWQSLVGYVPQFIYLSDKTIEENIAFGEKTEKINKGKVQEVAKISKIHDFINEKLPEKYLTNVGERGVRLSGGQIQRIGIARALYRDPKLLVLDEATNSLDYNTEQEVISGINNIKKDITIISIAHRIKNLKDYNFIYKVNRGKLKLVNI